MDRIKALILMGVLIIMISAPFIGLYQLKKYRPQIMNWSIRMCKEAQQGAGVGGWCEMLEEYGRRLRK